MPPKESSQPSVNDALCALFKEDFKSPRLLPVCCICGLVRDDESAAPSRPESWMTMKRYRGMRAVHATSFLFTHTYCPACLIQVQDSVKTYFSEKTGAVPTR